MHALAASKVAAYPTRRQVASDFEIGHSTLGKWVRMFSEQAKVPIQNRLLR